MFNTWTLKVRNFGKISKADVRVTPFMMFVGENNRGKSYLLELLWGIFKNIDTLLINYFINNDDYEKFEQLNNEFSQLIHGMLSDISEDSSKSITIDETFQFELLQLFNKALDNNKDALVKEIFNHSINIDHLEIVREWFFELKLVISPRVVKSQEQIRNKDSNELEEIIVSKTVYTLNIVYHDTKLDQLINVSTNTMLIDEPIILVTPSMLIDILTFLVCKDYSDSLQLPSKIKSSKFLTIIGARRLRDQTNKPIYFPASRTGFMHTYQTIIGNDRKTQNKLLKSLREAKVEWQDLLLNNNSLPLRLTAPVNDFLEKLSELYIDEDHQKLYADELAFLNEKILNGKVIKDHTQSIQFVPNQGEGIPLHITSSLVAELSPLAIFLESQYNPQLFIIEESESHLHVSKQLELVRLLFRLINKGKAIWLTTHSDSFAQQVNNLLTLSQHPDKDLLFEELGYGAVDTLEDVSYSSCYQFIEDSEGKTVVEEIPLGEYGYIIPSFNNVLEKLLIETSKIQDFGDRHD